MIASEFYLDLVSLKREFAPWNARALGGADAELMRS